MSIRVHRTWVLAGLLGATIVGTSVAPRALVVAGFFSGSGVNCSLCDDGPLVEEFSAGAPLRTLDGATWQVSPNGTPYAGGVHAGKPVRFRLKLADVVGDTGATHFLVTFTTVTTGSKPGLLHVRDANPGAKGEVKMIALPAAIGDTGLLERAYRTPGADNFLNPDDGTNSSTDPLPWDHPINTPMIDLALNMSGLDPGATWGLSAVIFGIHRMPCHCEPGAPQSLTNGCVPQNATDVAFSTLPPDYPLPQLYCPAATSPFASNSCGKRQPQAWSCPAVWDTGEPRELPFTCSVAPGPDGKGVYTCSSEGVASESIPPSSCSYVAKICQ